MPGSIKKTGKNLYEVRVQGLDQKTGRKRNLRAKVATRQEAESARSRMLAELANGRPERMRLSTYATLWLMARKAGLKPSVRAKYATSLELHIKPALGDYYLDSLNWTDVQAYVDERIADRRGRDNSNSVINELKLLRVMARDAVAEGVAPRDFCARVKQPTAPRYPDEKPNLLRADQVRAVLAEVPIKWRPLVSLLTFTGLRIGEATALRWEDVDWRSMELIVRRGNWKGQEVTPKTSRSWRRVPVPPGWLTEADRARSGLIFPTEGGGMHHGSPLRVILERACQRAGVPRITAHGLRRTFVDIGRRLTSARVMQSITGHSTQAMLDHYSMPEPQERRDTIEKMLAVAGLLGDSSDHGLAVSDGAQPSSSGEGKQQDE